MTMRYLITTRDLPPFYSAYFDAENHFNADAGMVVFDLHNDTYTTDGENWPSINIDRL